MNCRRATPANQAAGACLPVTFITVLSAQGGGGVSSATP